MHTLERLGFSNGFAQCTDRTNGAGNQRPNGFHTDLVIRRNPGNEPAAVINDKCHFQFGIFGKITKEVLRSFCKSGGNFEICGCGLVGHEV